MKKVNLLSRAEMKKIMGGYAAIGAPGGDNGNPCSSDGCQAGGGEIRHRTANGTHHLGNCNEHGDADGCHNYCFMWSGTTYWC